MPTSETELIWLFNEISRHDSPIFNVIMSFNFHFKFLRSLKINLPAIYYHKCYYFIVNIYEMLRTSPIFCYSIHLVRLGLWSDCTLHRYKCRVMYILGSIWFDHIYFVNYFKFVSSCKKIEHECTVFEIR